MRKIALALIAGVGAVGLSFVLMKTPVHTLRMHTYLRTADGLQTGTPVSIDGVRVGCLESLSVRAVLGDRPVDAILAIDTSYKLTIPNDSLVRLTSEGVLGPTVLEIDTRAAVGPPIENNGLLKSVEITDSQAARALEYVGNALIDASKKMRDKSPGTPTNPR